MTFTETLSFHLNAIQQRNFEQFLSTLTTGDELTLLTLSGLLINWRKDFIETMSSWFGDPDWRIHFETIRSYETTEMGFALVFVGYDDKDPQGNAYHLDYFLNLIFAKEGGQWRLVHDQNTMADMDNNG